MHLNAILTALTLAATSLAVPTRQLHVEIQGFTTRDNATTTYLALENNFFGQLSLQPDADETKAIRFHLHHNRTLESTSGQAIGVSPFWSAQQTTGAVTYDNYTGLEGTHVLRHNMEVVNTDPNWYSWAVCDNQYGYYIGYTSEAYNETLARSQYPFACHQVKFFARF